MDADLTNEIERLCEIYAKQDLYAFLYECQDTWIRTQHMVRPSSLFASCSPDGKIRIRRDGKPLGCPFSIRMTKCGPGEPLHAWTDEWTEAIRKDLRIPSIVARLSPERLVVLAEWQMTFRAYFADLRRAQLNSRPRRLRAMLKRSVAS